MNIPATQSEAGPPAAVSPRRSDGAVGPLADQSCPANGSASDLDRAYPTPPPQRVFFVQVRYRHIGRGEPMPLAPEDLDDPT